MNYIDELKQYHPRSEQEAADREMILRYIEAFPDTILTRENGFAHMTGSSMIFNRERDKVLMAYHNIYHSWSWTGGHADGEEDMLVVAKKEAKEETGVKTLKVLGKDSAEDFLAAVDVLPVWGHVKRGRYVTSHLHLNLSYLFEAEEKEILHIKEDENSQVTWLPVSEIRTKVSEPDMTPVYEKLIRLGQEIG